MPEDAAQQLGNMFSKVTRPGVKLTTQTIDDKHLPNLDVIGRTDRGIHLISPWKPDQRVLKENKHSLPTAKSVFNQPDMNPAPNLATYRARLRQMLLNAYRGKLPVDLASRRDHEGHQSFIDPLLGDTMIQDKKTGLLVSAFRRTQPTPLSKEPGQFTHWWDALRD